MQMKNEPVYQWKAFRQLARVDMGALQTGMNIGKGPPDLEKACRALYPELFVKTQSASALPASTTVNIQSETPDPTIPTGAAENSQRETLEPAAQPDPGAVAPGEEGETENPTGASAPPQPLDAERMQGGGEAPNGGAEATGNPLGDGELAEAGPPVTHTGAKSGDEGNEGAGAPTATPGVERGGEEGASAPVMSPRAEHAVDGGAAAEDQAAERAGDEGAIVAGEVPGVPKVEAPSARLKEEEGGEGLSTEVKEEGGGVGAGG